VIERPHEMLSLSLAAVAQQARVSEPTVIRCCRSLGSRGFSDFKMRMAQSLASGPLYVPADVRPEDSVADMAAKVISRAASTLLQLRSQLDPVRLEKAIALLCNAQRVECYGLGNSGIIAADMRRQLLRLGLPAMACLDARVQVVSAAMLRAGDVAVAISASGQSLDLLSSVEHARSAGAEVIGITALGSPLAARCSVALELHIEDTAGSFAPQSPRLAQLAVVDVLAAGVALRQNPERLARLPRNSEGARGKRGRH
jgi:RpiR family transcriptional regulator, carbohydrate utilization regulator